MITYLFAVILSQQRDVNVSCLTLVCHRKRDELNDVTLCAHVTRDALNLLHQQLIQLNVVNRLLTTRTCTHIQHTEVSVVIVTSETATSDNYDVVYS